MVLAFGLLLASITSPQAPLPQELSAQINSIFSSPSVATAKVGVYVRRLDDGAEIYAREPDTQVIPASNVKIVTSAAALRILGPDYRYATDVFGTVDANGVMAGDLVLKGSGDPSIVPEKLWYLASRIVFGGVKEIRGNVVVDDSFFIGNRQAVGFEQDRTSSAYMAPMGAVSVGFNAVLVHVLPGSVNGAAARIMVDPPSSYAAIEGTVTTVTSGRSYVNVDVVPSGDRSVVRVSGRINMYEGGRGFWRKIDNPPVFAGEVLKAALEQQGVKIRGKVKLAKVPEGAVKLVTLTSPRMSEIVNWLNKNSNNFVAEQLALTVGAAAYGAPGTWDKAQMAIEGFLENEVGWQKGSYRLKNGSGLHDVNRMTPRQLVQVLDYMYRKPQLFPEFASSMAVAGGSGTLEGRMGKTDAAHLLRAKTGTLQVASALSGYVTTKSGETLAFSILVNDYKSPISGVWEVQDALGALLAGLSFATNGAAVAQKEPSAEALTQ